MDTSLENYRNNDNNPINRLSNLTSRNINTQKEDVGDFGISLIEIPSKIYGNFGLFTRLGERKRSKYSNIIKSMTKRRLNNIIYK